MRTHLFKSGNSIAVRIPKGMKLAQAGLEVELVEVGSTIMIRPVTRRSVAEVLGVLSKMPASFMPEGREFQEEQERDWSGLTQPSPNKADH